MRLDKYIADSTAHSRKDVKRLVKAGRVTVNDLPAKLADLQLKESDRVAVDDQAVVYRQYVYLMMNKPQGYLSATEDGRDPVVIDLLPEEYRHFAPFPVGRLDKDSEGLLILTNDGQFAHAATAPKKRVYKRYFAVLDQPAQTGDIAVFEAGMEFKEFTALPARLEITADPHEVYVEIAEGKFHQVKRMCERVGKTVIFLKRVAVGGLALDPALGPGEVRELTEAELEQVRA